MSVTIHFPRLVVPVFILAFSGTTLFTFETNGQNLPVFPKESVTIVASGDSGAIGEYEPCHDPAPPRKSYCLKTPDPCPAGTPGNKERNFTIYPYPTDSSWKIQGMNNNPAPQARCGYMCDYYEIDYYPVCPPCSEDLSSGNNWYDLPLENGPTHKCLGGGESAPIIRGNCSLKEPVSPKSLDFGVIPMSCEISSTQRVLVFKTTLRRESQYNVVVDNPVFKTDRMNGTIPASNSGNIEDLTTTTLKISAVPLMNTTAGTYQATMKIYHQDPCQENPFIIPLKVSFSSKEIRLSLKPNAVDFGMVKPLSQVQREVVITNTGISAEPVVITGFMTTSLAGFEVLPKEVSTLPWTIPPGKSKTFNIKFSPQKTGTYTTILAISSNACKENTTIKLSGKCDGGSLKRSKFKKP